VISLKPLLSGLLLLSGYSATVHAGYQGSIPPGSSLLFSVHAGSRADQLVLSERAGKVLWSNQESLFHPQMVEALDDATVLCATQDGAHILNARGESIWRYQLPPNVQNCVVKRLEENRFLVGHEGPGRLLEINRQFDTLHEVVLTDMPNRNHGQFRYLTITPEGSYLVPVNSAKLLREYDRAGKILREITDLPQVTYAQRLESGNTLVSFRGTIREYDPEWESVLWEFSLQKDAGLPVAPVINFVCLPKGHLLMSLYHGNEGPDLIEINRSRKVVHRWSFPDSKNVAHVTLLAPDHPFSTAVQRDAD